ncbi:MAG: hypothetical protein LW650_03860 [Planctomycetaceae bacterium]|nr:hypothetical protein [Planctomycetaceae bacterium]
MERGSSGGGALGVAALFGVVGVLVAGAVGPLRCERCGRIRRAEFAPSVRAEMVRNPVVLGASAVALVVVAVLVLVKLAEMR